MQRKFMKNLMLVLTLVVLCLAVGLSASAEERTVIDSGECGAQGDNVIWTLYDDGEFVLSGEGAMMDYWISLGDGSDTVITTDWYNYDISKITIEYGITHIGAGAFEYDGKGGENLFTTIEFPESVKSIGKNAFFRSEKLVEIFISSSVTEIGQNAFSNCTSLKSIVVDKNNEYYSSDEFGVLFNKDKSELILYPRASEITKYSIPSATRYIHKYAFEYSYNLVEIELTDNLVVGEFAFTFCVKLENIVFPKKANNIVIEPYSFCNCYSLKVIEIPDGVVLGDSAFEACMGVEEVILSYNVESVGVAAISIMPFIEKIYVKGKETHLEDYALGLNSLTVSGISRDEFIEFLVEAVITQDELLYNELMQYVSIPDNDLYMCLIGTIYAHEGSWAEKYVEDTNKEFGDSEAYGQLTFVPTHFFEGEWTYDYDNMVRTRKCIYCDVTETEKLESTEDDDGEITDPVEPETPEIPDTPDMPETPEEETKDDLFSKIFDLIKTFFELIMSMFK